MKTVISLKDRRGVSWEREVEDNYPYITGLWHSDRGEMMGDAELNEKYGPFFGIEVVKR